MSTCQWCGDEHGIDRLCQRAQRAMTRRSFCFVFGAGLVGTLAPRQYMGDVWVEIAQIEDMASLSPTHKLVQMYQVNALSLVMRKAKGETRPRIPFSEWDRLVTMRQSTPQFPPQAFSNDATIND